MFGSKLLTSKVLLNSTKEEKKLDFWDEMLLSGREEHGCLLDSGFWIFFNSVSAKNWSRNPSSVSLFETSCFLFSGQLISFLLSP